MTVEVENKGVDQRRKVLVGIRLDKESKQLLVWALVKVAEPGDHVVAVHVSRNSEDTPKEKLLLDDYIKVFQGIGDITQVKLTGKIVAGKSIKKTLVKEANNSAADSLIVGITKQGSIGGWTSTAKYFAKHLPSTIEILSVHNGKLVFKRTSIDHPQGDPKPSYHKHTKILRNESELGDSEVSKTHLRIPKMKMDRSKSETESSSTADSNGEVILENKDVMIEVHNNTKRSPTSSRSSASVCTDCVSNEQRPGWPLLRRAILPTQKALDSRKMSVIQWVMSLPDRSPPDTPQSTSSNSNDTSSNKSESPLGRQNSSMDGVYSRTSSQSIWSEFLEEPSVPFESSLSNFTWFTYDVLRHATSHFSSDNLIGKGRCSRVYKGVFLDGKQVAVKVLKSSKQAWEDFSLEVNVMSTLRHQNITPLLGVCVDNSELISVYEFVSKGSLEENLHGGIGNKQESGLSWEARFKIAVGIAEALVYLHNGCPKPVIHRDVKSSNILLSQDFEPQLSDFGLAIWVPNSSSCYTDVVGTFGYLAPEYFMYGKVTHKLDVYSFGVVLELVSGRKPIDSCKGQKSLVMWAKPILESGKLKEVVDPILEGCDQTQLRRMVVAAKLCLTRAPGSRPNMNQILGFLKGDETMMRCHVNEEEDENDEFRDDEIDGNYSLGDANKSNINNLATMILDDDDDFTFETEKVVQPKNKNRPCLEDFLNQKLQPDL